MNWIKLDTLNLLTLTLTPWVDLQIIHVHALAEFENHMSSRSPDMNFGYVTYRQTDRK